MSFPSAQIMHCATHVGQANSDQLNDLKAKKTFMKAVTGINYHLPAICCAKGSMGEDVAALLKDSQGMPNQSLPCVHRIRKRPHSLCADDEETQKSTMHKISTVGAVDNAHSTHP